MKNRDWVSDSFPSVGLPARMLLTVPWSLIYSGGA